MRPFLVLRVMPKKVSGNIVKRGLRSADFRALCRRVPHTTPYALADDVSKSIGREHLRSLPFLFPAYPRARITSPARGGGPRMRGGRVFSQETPQSASLTAPLSGELFAVRRPLMLSGSVLLPAFSFSRISAARGAYHGSRG